MRYDTDGGCRRGAVALFAGLVAGGWLFAPVAASGASESGRPVEGFVRVAQQLSAFSVEDISGPAGEPLPLRIELPPKTNELFRVLMFRGLPEGVRLTEGFALDEAWAVSPENAHDLALVAPEGFSGTFELQVIYIYGSKDARQSSEITVSVGQSAAKPEPALSPEVEETMFGRGRELLKVGEVAGARLVFDYLARQGSERGAFALAQTYDPEFFDSLAVRGGVKPDMTRALKWYREAARLGSEPAATRLSALKAAQ